jgi:hypothetical protein
MMIDLRPCYTKWVKGTWRPWRDRDFQRQRDVETAAVCCGNCGRAMSVKNHSISASGVLSPSLVCPHGCGWHVFARLAGWQNRSRRTAN